MDKESIIELQKTDANCNDCAFMARRQDIMTSFNHLHIGQEKASHRLNYGDCMKFGKLVSFIPNTCQLETQECFKHRRG
jgi:hypothetical protein